jgi:dienelactone hydrolase
MPRRRLGAIAIGLSLMLGQSAAVTIGAADDLPARQQALAPYFHMFRPSGRGPFPAVVFVSGCSGFAPSIAPHAYTRAAERWRSKGYVVVFTDYLAARRLPSCPSAASLTAPEIGKDILAVASYVRAQPFVVPTRITAIGWSLGGGGVLAALSQIASSENRPLHSVIAYYPSCLSVPPWRSRVPALILMGAQDEVTRPAVCQRLVEQLPPGLPVDTRIYAGARHGFDVSDLPPYVRFGREILGYSAAPAAAAARDIDEFMRHPPSGTATTTAPLASPRAQVPTACAAIWARYAAATGTPVRPSAYYAKEQPFPGEAVEVTIQKVAEGHVWIHVHYTGDSSSPFGTFDVVENKVATLIGRDTFFWRNLAQSDIRLRQVDHGISGYLDSALGGQCVPMSLTEVSSARPAPK